LALLLPILSSATTSDTSLFLSQLTEKLTEHFRTDGQLILEATRPINMPKGSYELTLLEAPSTLSSLLIVRVRLSPVGTSYPTEHSIALRAQLLQDAWATRAPVERDQTIDLAQLEARRVDTLRDRDAILVSSDLRDLSFTRTITTSRILSWPDLSRRVLIRKGQLVEVTATDGQLAITIKALALENAQAGSTVKVRNIESRKDFTAHVVAENRAQVRF
jgi:flagella basal body P-ring formation protein FlgA